MQEVGTLGKCLACDRPGHYVRDCRMLKEYKKKYGWKKGSMPSPTGKHESPKGGWPATQKGKLAQKRQVPVKKRTVVVELQEEEGDYEEPEGGSNEEIAEVSESSEDNDLEGAEQGNT